MKKQKGVITVIMVVMFLATAVLAACSSSGATKTTASPTAAASSTATATSKPTTAATAAPTATPIPVPDYTDTNKPTTAASAYGNVVSYGNGTLNLITIGTLEEKELTFADGAKISSVTVKADKTYTVAAGYDKSSIKTGQKAIVWLNADSKITYVQVIITE